VVGVVVTEIAYRGRRQQAMASARLGYLEAVETSAKIAADGSSSP
jgi:BMFP domain-containing protein YqiC